MQKVSIIVPIYGVEKFIKRCATSLFEQTLDDVEYIFVDDCTKDCSVDVLESVIQKYPSRKPQIKIIHHERNKGLPIARQTGLRCAQGEYIAHCDSDDWVDINIYQLMYQTAKRRNADIVTCDYYQGDEENHTRHYVRHFDRNTMISAMLTHTTPVSVWNKLVKRDLYFGADIIYPHNNFGEDLALMIQIVNRSNVIEHIDMPLYYYYCNEDSLTKGRTPERLFKNWQDMSSNTQIIIDYLRGKGLLDNYKNEIINLKEECRSMILPIINMPGNRDRYLNQYPELVYTLFDLFNKESSLYAGRYWLTKLRLYSLGAKIKGLIRRK